jgi:acetate kinase
LTLNRGSSSIKFAVYAAGDPPVRLLAGEVAKMLPIPRRFEAMGVRRYGFHRQEDL